MVTRTQGALLVAAMIVLLPGCGSNVGGPPGPGQTVTLGPVQLGVTSAAGFKSFALNSPWASPVAFAVAYGSRIVRADVLGRGKIAFMSDRAGNRDIWVMNADGSGVSQLTSDPGIDDQPSWSPDGRKTAFTSNRSGSYDIWVMKADGSGATDLTNDQQPDWLPAWSPDGTRIAFTKSWGVESQTDIYVMRADGTAQQPVASGSYDESDPTWSPDGRQLAYVSNQGGTPDIWVTNLDGSGQGNLTANSVEDYAPAWSPDGKRIVFSSMRSGGPQLWAMNADGTDPVQLTTSAAGGANPTWSADGRSIAFAGCYSGWTYDIYAMDVQGGSARNLTAAASYDDSPDWSRAPAVVRSLIGAAGSDEGSNPPFGTQKPLLVVGLTDADGLVSAATVDVPRDAWSSIVAAPFEHTGGSLVGMKITADSIRRLLEDMGPRQPVRSWNVAGPPPGGALLVFFSATTGRVRTVLVTGDTSLAMPGACSPTTTQLAGGRLVVQAPIVQACDARDPGRSLLAAPTRQVVLDARTGQIVSTSAGSAKH